jgi:hypothetical protein
MNGKVYCFSVRAIVAEGSEGEYVPCGCVIVEDGVIKVIGHDDL